MENKSDILNKLITVSEDGHKGFSEAAQTATDSKLKTLFGKCANDCSQAVSELQQLVHKSGGKPEDSGSVVAAAHRGWLKVKATVEDTNIAVLEEVERGQDHAKAAYTHALKQDLDPATRMVIERQAAGAKANHDQVRDLRNAYKAAA